MDTQGDTTNGDNVNVGYPREYNNDAGFDEDASAAAASDWAPTPLSEIRAKHLKRQAERMVMARPDSNMSMASSSNSSAAATASMHSAPVAAAQHQQQRSTISGGNSGLAPPQQVVVETQRHHPGPLQQQLGTSNIVSSSWEHPHPAMSLPSTLLPPSVMTSFMLPATKKGGTTHSATATSSSTGGSGGVSRSGGGGSKKSSRVESPQDVLERILLHRGYAKTSSDILNLRIKAEDSCYDSTPSPLQLASFGTELVKAIHVSDVDKLRALLDAGLSPNPCNQFRDSIVDLVCKRGNAEIFQVLVEHGCDLRVCDGFGRTPLHHCCWASEFCPYIAQAIIATDPQQLFMEDKRGQLPLEYVRPDQKQDWFQYLEDNADRFFPAGGSVPPAVSLKETRRNGHLPDPVNALPIQLASAVSSGQITPKKVAGVDPTIRARF
jgi:hypothetical protein